MARHWAVADASAAVRHREARARRVLEGRVLAIRRLASKARLFAKSMTRRGLPCGSHTNHAEAGTNLRTRSASSTGPGAPKGTSRSAGQGATSGLIRRI